MWTYDGSKQSIANSTYTAHPFTPTTSWGFQTHTFAPADWPSGTKFMQPFVIPGYLQDTGYIEYQDFRVEECTPGTLIVDGSITTSKMYVTSLDGVSANLGTITAGRAQNSGNTNFIDFNATGTSSFLKVGSAVDIKADGSGYFARTIVSAPWVDAYSNSYYSYVTNVATKYIRTGLNETSDPWNSSENTSRVARVGPVSGARNAGHNATFWFICPTVLDCRGFEVSGPNYLAYDSANWYWGDIGIQAYWYALSYASGEYVDYCCWAIMRV
jgi:hypothetical protein